MVKTLICFRGNPELRNSRILANVMQLMFLVTGPSRKRHISSSSNSEEDEKEERKKSKMRWQRSPRMKPRKLFKSCKTRYLY